MPRVAHHVVLDDELRVTIAPSLSPNEAARSGLSSVNARGGGGLGGCSNQGWSASCLRDISAFSSAACLALSCAIAGRAIDSPSVAIGPGGLDLDPVDRRDVVDGQLQPSAVRGADRLAPAVRPRQLLHEGREPRGSPPRSAGGELPRAATWRMRIRLPRVVGHRFRPPTSTSSYTSASGFKTSRKPRSF